MADMLDYLRWRGDVLFTQSRLNVVDALIFSALSYIRFDGVVSALPDRWMLLRDAAGAVLSMPDARQRARVEQDLALLELAARSPRFEGVGMSFYRNVFIPEEETQFSAVTFFLPDGTAFLAFRGTDSTLVGWKEDFNMTFQKTIPSQRLALDYLEEFGAASPVAMRLGGHSKGGNLAVFAGACCGDDLRRRILEVYNQDGPGFAGEMMEDPGYLSLVPRIRTYIPQSAVFGMLLEHEEPYTVIKSRETGAWQHEPYSWEVLGPGFVEVEAVTEESLFLDRTLKRWLAGMSLAERNALVDTVFELLSAGGARNTRELITPKTIHGLIQNLRGDEEARNLIAGELANLIQAAAEPDWWERMRLQWLPEKKAEA